MSDLLLTTFSGHRMAYTWGSAIAKG